MIIGTKDGKAIEIEESVNPHILVTGISGSGKSVFCKSQIVQRAKAGERIIAFNYHNVLAREQMLPEIRRIYEQNCCVIKVKKGIPLPLFTPFPNAYGEEDYNVTVHRISNLLKVAGNLTDPQTRVLNEAVKYVMKKGMYETDGIKAIALKLDDIGGPVANRTISILRALFEMNTIIDGDFLNEKARIIELDFEGIEYDDQATIVRLVTDFYLRLAMTMRFANEPITLFMDEVQNFDFGAGSTMRAFVNEGRKLGVTLLMATPSLFTSGQANMKILNQVGIHVVFRPLRNECGKMAAELDKRRRAYLMCELPDLKQGQFLYGFTPKESGERTILQVLETYIPGMDYQEALS